MRITILEKGINGKARQRSFQRIVRLKIHESKEHNAPARPPNYDATTAKLRVRAQVTELPRMAEI